jgi:hypothetical protein
VSETIKYERMKVLNKIIRDLDINIASCLQAVRRGLATKEANYPSTPCERRQPDPEPNAPVSAINLY